MVASRLLNGTLNTPIAITIPSIISGGLLGVHRLRASVAFANTPNPCSAAPITYGETHDYTVNIVTMTGRLLCF